MQENTTPCPCPACDDRRQEASTYQFDGRWYAHALRGNAGPFATREQAANVADCLRIIDRYDDPRYHEFGATRPLDGNTGYAADAVTCRYCGFGPAAHASERAS